MRRMQAGALAVIAAALTLSAGTAVADPATDSAADELALEPSLDSASGLRASGSNGVLGGPFSAPRLPRRFALSGLDAYIPTERRVPYSDTRLAQFQIPQAGSREGVGPSRQAARDIQKELSFNYAFGTDSEFTYSRNADLDSRNRDNLIFAAPTAFLLTTVRPTASIDLNFEFTFEQQIRIHEEQVTLLPNGDVLPADKRKASLLIDQANIVLKNFPEPFVVTLGRRNYEDPRLFLYDSAMDGIHVGFKVGDIDTEMSYSRENRWDGDLFRQTVKTSVTNHILYTEYRGIEDHKLAAYAIARSDSDVNSPSWEGRPRFFGLRAYGIPSDQFNYWSELSILRGSDEQRDINHGKAWDFGGTYRFPKAPFAPCLTFGMAFGSGDENENDTINKKHRQTNLQSNETRFCGVTQFKRYGEFADVELNNVRILTAGFGFRAAPGIFVDLVAHRYRTNYPASDFRSSGITAEMNQPNGVNSKRVGHELDVILGFRNLFGTRLGFEARAGVFFPGAAYNRNEGTNARPRLARADKGISVLAVIIY
ncbi:MAG: alginate export family protein [Burkholderiaceae bacterium]